MSTFAFGNGGVPQSRVVYRGSNNANPNCGVSNTNVNNDASASNSNVGSRLANYQSVPRQGWTCPHCRTEGDKPRQKHSSGWNCRANECHRALLAWLSAADNLKRSLESQNIKCRVEFGRFTPRLEELRPGERKAHAFSV